MKIDPSKPWLQIGVCSCMTAPLHHPNCETLVMNARKELGESLLGKYWKELDLIMERLMTDPAEDGRDPGRAENAAYFIALCLDTRHPNIQAIKKEALQRWKRANEE